MYGGTIAPLPLVPDPVAKLSGSQRRTPADRSASEDLLRTHSCFFLFCFFSFVLFFSFFLTSSSYRFTFFSSIFVSPFFFTLSLFLDLNCFLLKIYFVLSLHSRITERMTPTLHLVYNARTRASVNSFLLLRTRGGEKIDFVKSISPDLMMLITDFCGTTNPEGRW